MVVTSPIGDHEPPAFAAIITIQAYFKRSVRSGTSLRNTAMITIAAAKLSNKAEKKKVAKLIYPPIFSLPPPSELPLVAHPDGDALAVEIFEKRDDVLAGKAAGKLLEPGGIEIVM